MPEALTFGEDRTDSLARAVDAIETALMAAMAAREDIAEPKASGGDYVTLPALSSAKVALYQAMRADGVGKAELGRRLDVALPQIDRLLDLRHNSRLDAIERASRLGAIDDDSRADGGVTRLLAEATRGVDASGARRGCARKVGEFGGVAEIKIIGTRQRLRIRRF